MKSDVLFDQDFLDDETTADTAVTPPSTILWDGISYSVPWPNNTYIIVEKGSDQAITVVGNRLCLQHRVANPDANNTWLCVEKNNYFSFLNLKSGVYLGHDGNAGMLAKATAAGDWEFFTARRHPEGGYQLLTPYYWHTLMMVTTTGSGDGKRLARTSHGSTLWEFIKV